MPTRTSLNSYDMVESAARMDAIEGGPRDRDAASEQAKTRHMASSVWIAAVKSQKGHRIDR